MTAALAIIFDVFHLYRCPAPEFEIVRDDAGTFFQLPLQQRLHFIVGIRQQVYRN
jgi:hypothetical protein